MEELKENDYNYLFDDRELDDEAGVDIDLTDEELENLLSENDKIQLKKELDEAAQNFKIEYED